MKKILYFIFFIIVLAIGLIFTIYNSNDVVLHYVIGSISLPLSLILVITIIVGAFLGVTFSSIMIIRMRNEVMQIKKQYKNKT